jgi:tellurite resistance protein TerC
VEISIWFWVGFNAFVLAMLALDLGVFHRDAHEVTLREATVWSVVWVALALVFNAGLYLAWGAQPALEFLTGYVIEKSLSVDNIFVFVMLFSYFAVPARYQHRVLFWGILGALLLRGAFIAAGAYVLEQFHWVIYVFGAILILTGIKLARRAEVYDPGSNPVLKLARRVLPLTPRYHGPRFWVKEGGKWVATPLFLVLLLVEMTDLVFAIDSIPAIFAVTQEPFLVYTANVFAILGLRSMYFLLAGVVHRFVYLKYGLAMVLVFVGAKMLLVDVYKVPTTASLLVVATVIAGSIVLSLRRGTGGDASDGARDPRQARPGSPDSPPVVPRAS